MHAHHASRRRLWQVFLLLVSYAAVEIGVGIIVNSISLQGDGWHMVLDAVSIMVALITAAIADNSQDERRSKRIEAYGASLSAFLLLPPASYLLISGTQRFMHPQMLNAPWVSVTSFVGLLVNVACYLLLHQHRRSSLNIRGATLHILADLLNSLAVIASGIIITATRQTWIDGALAAAIGAFLMLQGLKLWRDAQRVIRQNGR